MSPRGSGTYPVRPEGITRADGLGRRLVVRRIVPRSAVDGTDPKATRRFAQNDSHLVINDALFTCETQSGSCVFKVAEARIV